MIQWHRLLGLMMEDLFAGTPFEVEVEVDLSLHRQFIDILIVRKEHFGELKKLPDGLDLLNEHNLLSYINV